jgi:small subunit ribosomal protein S17
MADTPTADIATQVTPDDTSRLQRRTGRVSSASGDKTIRVVIDSRVKHPKYGKFMHRRTKLAAHDPQNAAKVGDTVEIVPCRRMSKSKSWRLAKIVRTGEAVAEIPAQG